MKVIKIFIAAVCLLSITGCNEDFLEKLPLTTVSPETFYTKAENLETALYGLYDAFQATGVYAHYPQTLDYIADDIHSGTYDFANGIHTPLSTGFIPANYGRSYTAIVRANLILANINAEGIISDPLRKSIEAETRFLRALAYERLVYFFGDVPLVKTPITISEALSVTRTNRNEVIDFVISELKFAADNLAITSFGGNKARANKLAALGVRARILTYEARTGKKNWADALAALTEVRTLAESNGVALFTSGDGTNAIANYEDIFKEPNEANKEILFFIQHNASDGHAMHIDISIQIAGGDGGPSIYQEFVESYDMTDGTTGTPVNIAAPASFANRDPRLYASVYLPGFTPLSSGGTYDPTAPYTGLRFTPFALRKWINEKQLKSVASGLDYIILRYADILLLYAEAENEVNGPTVNAYTAINRIRQRVKMPVIASGLSKDIFRTKLREERRHELFFEGNRWLDLVQWGIANTRINAIPGRKFQVGKNELFPIPQVERDRNKNLTQNPNY